MSQLNEMARRTVILCPVMVELRPLPLRAEEAVT